MKTVRFLSLITLAGVLFLGTSCNDDDEGAKPEDNIKDGGKALFGEYTQDITLKKNETYTVKGSAIFKGGSTLSVEEGVTIEGDASVISYILIEQDADINATGTADNPVIMTASVKKAGSWGGLHICGKAPINVTGGTGESEIGGATYGGSDADDNSGTIKYVRLEYTGVALDSEHESNGLSLYGVGAGTTIEYVQTYMGADDGFEFFGGTVNIKHVVSTGSSDDSFDWTEGWSGKGQYLIANQTTGNGDRGIEGDNNGNDNEAAPFASPMLSQVTLIGGYPLSSEKGKYGMKLREGTKGDFYNIIVNNFDKRTIHVEHNQTITNVNNEDLTVNYAVLNSEVSSAVIKYSVSKVDSVDYDGNPVLDEDGEVIEIDDPNAPVLVDAKKFENRAGAVIMEKTNAEIGTDPSVTFVGGKDAKDLDVWFDSDDQIGAGTDWAAGWTLGLN